ncbi:SDR family oxidoreductase [Saccharothrix syringae]|uniref:SDR family oxidoreductase n=1 Tax=Saccharothrix syringae TaxID=103733 RepID=A0A5Q0GWA2_SACSY|nr:SDR family oxidoreductase [Saccharothrix syringae]QFZ18173.1 SDR family oxidoreductase [Saccharothrix syringae]
MTTQHVLVIGGGSGMGLALARLLLDRGDRVTIAGRSADRLARAAAVLGAPGLLRTRQLDITREEQVRDLADTGPLDHVVVTAADATGAYAPLGEFDLERARAVVDTKLLGPWLVAKHVRPNPGGSITFTSGVAAYRPGPGASVIASANGALESLARALALELAPVRVNVVSPGWVDTPVWDVLAGEAKHERLAAMAGRLPVGRVGRAEDVAGAFDAVLRNGFLTGEVIHVDGGHRLV